MNSSQQSHSDTIDAAFTLLREAVEIVGDKLPFVVVGGWSPYLLCDHKGVHPGTRDVDLLFDISSSTEQLGEIVSNFVGSGFLRSAKHDFQLLRPLKIGDSEFVFNVDFLHPAETTENSPMFIEHIEWPEYYDKMRKKRFSTKSIALPSAQIVFGHRLFEDHQCHHGDLEFEIPLMDELGLLITKLESWKSKKRQRDAYDLFLSLNRPRNREKLVDRTRSVRAKDDTVDGLLKLFSEELSLEKYEDPFCQNISRYDPSIKDGVAQVLSFLKETVPKKRWDQIADLKIDGAHPISEKTEGQQD